MRGLLQTERSGLESHHLRCCWSQYCRAGNSKQTKTQEDPQTLVHRQTTNSDNWLTGHSEAKVLEVHTVPHTQPSERSGGSSHWLEAGKKSGILSPTKATATSTTDLNFPLPNQVSPVRGRQVYCIWNTALWRLQH